ncbi:MAG TPA: Clp protease N-terminal domain-containing protein [Acidimicrobiales bacterium]|nr:Clp protease N-terminal domain-containing protein [Acidimicrobiales bacterium]
MFERLRRGAATHRDTMELIKRAGVEARRLGAPALEAEHLLLAMVDGPGAPARVLSSLGLSRERITEALDRELAAALARADLHVAPLPRPRAVDHGGRLEWGESARRAAERSIGESPDHPGLRMLLAVVHAEGGVVPRLVRELGLSVEDVERAVARTSMGAPDSKW